MSVEKLCYEGGVQTVYQIIEHRISKGKSNFQRFDEDKEVPFIVPKVTWNAEIGTGSLNNEHWAYCVGYAFREALDLQFMERIRDKKKVNLWSQGCILNFKEGDLISSKCGKKYVQVKYASPMGWDEDKNEMYYGSVTYSYVDNENSIKEQRHTTQTDFLSLLING
ncbi:hypothetical protein QTO12_04550 [Vibrio owensii]|uniref:Uncharacterized protein n=1 Tax=Vibrio parahaemolyticus TaxID=670 RepID=A0A9Q3YFY4_VIBPH|nr:hypothetical protein [Vibrio parahaemolyticus]MCC3803444.1 hypothetical protein [Vibrio parahaemolyticus]MCR9779356.1 hypothetical protein [Vibrio parahaemolyticus]